MQQLQSSRPVTPSTLPFVLFWAENVSNQSKAGAGLVFSPSANGMIQDPNSIHVGTETTGDPFHEAADVTVSKD